MNKYLCLLFLSVSFNSIADDSSLSPTVYADISETAIEDSVTFDGARGVVGLAYSDLKLESSMNDKFKIGGAVIAAQYAKILRNNIWLALDVGTDVSTVKENKDSYKTDRITPFCAFKCGYRFKKYHMIGYLKGGINRIGVKCNFVGAAKANAIVPFVGLGVERKINSRWGIAFECSVSIPKTVTKTFIDQQTKIKFSRKDIKIMATYDMSKK